MTVINANTSFAGELAVRIIRVKKAPLKWRLKNAMRLNYLKGLLGALTAKSYSKLTGVMTIQSALYVRARQNGEWFDYGCVGRHVVTNAGVAILADDFVDGSGEVTNFKYHGVGTGATAEAVGDTALVTESTTALNPDSTRATGTNTNPSAPVYRSIGTVTFDASATIQEHGIFSQAATGGGTLWDRTVHGSLAMGSGDAIQYTYELTVNAGG